jgi:hypothetical protein
LRKNTWAKQMKIIEWIVKWIYNEYTIYKVHEPSWKTFKGENCIKPRGLSESSPLRTDFSGQSDRRLDLLKGWPKMLYSKLAQGGAIRLESAPIRWFSWLPGRRLDHVDGGQRCSRGELENNSRKPRDLTKKMHCDSLKKGQFTLSQGMVKKGDDVVL